MALTSFAKTVDALLRSDHGTTLNTFITVRRERGLPFQVIAEDLRDLTDGTVDVTRTTIANWATDLLQVAS